VSRRCRSASPASPAYGLRERFGLAQAALLRWTTGDKVASGMMFGAVGRPRQSRRAANLSRAILAFDVSASLIADRRAVPVLH
jgi:hypothetical protein